MNVYIWNANLKNINMQDSKKIQAEWRSQARRILNAIILITIVSCANIVVDYLGSVNDTIDLFHSLDSGRFDQYFMPDEWDIAGYVLVILLIVGYGIYLSGLVRFADLQPDTDNQLAVRSVRSGIGWMLWGIVLGVIPVVGGFFKFLFSLISSCILIGAFGRLKRSRKFPTRARMGAGSLKASAILELIALIIGLVPFAGGVIAGILSFIAFCLLLSGWERMKNANVLEVEEVASSQQGPVVVNVNAGAITAVTSSEYASKAAAKSDDELTRIITNAADYNPELVRAAQAEKICREERKQKEVLRQRAGGMSDDELEKMIANRAEYSELLMDAVRAELDRRHLQKEEEEKRLKGARIREEEQFRYAPGYRSEPKQAVVESSSVQAVVQEPMGEKPEKASASQVVSGQTSVSESSPKKNYGAVIAGVVAAVLLAGGIVGYLLWYKPYAKDRDALRTYVVADNVFLRSSQMAGVEYNIIGKVPYGQEVITYYLGPEWAEVKVNDMTGYIASDYLLKTNDFILLNGVWGDEKSRECVASTKCRMAILDYYKRKALPSGKSGWQVFTRQKDLKPNAVFYPRLYDKNSKFTDFVFLMKNNVNGERQLVCYSFNDATEIPVYRFHEEAPADGYIQNMQMVGGRLRVAYSNGTTSNILLW